MSARSLGAYSARNLRDPLSRMRIPGEEHLKKTGAIAARALYHSALMRYLLALDQGTTRSRALLFDERTALLGMTQEEHPQIYPEPGWVEHDPELLWQTQVRPHVGCSPSTASAGARWRDWGSPTSGRAGGRSRTPSSRRTARTASHCERLRGAGLEPMVRDKTGLLLDPYFGATKLAWLLAHLPGARRRADRAELRSWPEPEDEGRSGAGSDRCGRSDSTIRRTRRSQAACIAHFEIPMINNRRYGTRDIGVGAHGMCVRLLRTGESPDGI
jgi:hypothetical protein